MNGKATRPGMIIDLVVVILLIATITEEMSRMAEIEASMTTAGGVHDLGPQDTVAAARTTIIDEEARALMGDPDMRLSLISHGGMVQTSLTYRSSFSQM
jgi:hypothetical protein